MRFSVRPDVSMTGIKNTTFPSVFMDDHQLTKHLKKCFANHETHSPVKLIPGSDDLLTSEDDASWGKCSCPEVLLRCRSISTIWYRIINLFPYRRNYHYAQLTCCLGPTNSRSISVIVKPLSTSALGNLIRVIATTTKICTENGSTQIFIKSFDTRPHALLHVLSIT
jgi:hypothetical protein